MFPIENGEDLEKLKELVSLKNQVEDLMLQDKLGKQKSHENIKKIHEPLTDTIKVTSRVITKTITENSIKSNKALENFTDKFLEIRKDRGIIASYLLSSLSKITNPENTAQFRLVKNHYSNRVNDLLIHHTIPVTPYNNFVDIL